MEDYEFGPDVWAEVEAGLARLGSEPIATSDDEHMPDSEASFSQRSLASSGYVSDDGGQVQRSQFSVAMCKHLQQSFHQRVSRVTAELSDLLKPANPSAEAQLADDADNEAVTVSIRSSTPTGLPAARMTAANGTGLEAGAWVEPVVPLPPSALVPAMEQTHQHMAQPERCAQPPPPDNACASMREAERVDLQRKMLALQLAYMRKRIAAGRIARAWKRYLSSPARAHKLAAVARIQAAARGCSARLLAHQLRQRRDALGALEQAAKSGQRDALEVAAKQAEALGLGQDAGRKLQAFELSARTAQHELKRTAQHGIQAEFEAALGRAMVFAHMGGLVAEAQAAFAKRRRDAEAALVASLQDEPATIIKRLLTVAASLGVSQQHLESCSNAVAQRDADAVADLRSAAAASPFSGEQMRSTLASALQIMRQHLAVELAAGSGLVAHGTLSLDDAQDEYEAGALPHDSSSSSDDPGLEGVTDLANLGQLCPQLTSLAVNCNQLCDMHGILSCSALVELKLKKNRIPVIAGLRVLQQLRHLDLSDNDLTSMDGLQHCACLEQLELRHNQIASIGDALVGCTALTNLFEAFPLELPSVMLRELRLADNWIPSIPVLPWLPHLEELDLSNNAVTSIGPLHGLPNLRRLNLALNKLPSLDSLAALTPLSHLAALYLGDNPVAGLPGYARAVRCHLPNVTLEGYSEELGVARGGSQEALVRAMQSSPLAVPHYVRQCRMLSRPLFWQATEPQPDGDPTDFDKYGGQLMAELEALRDLDVPQHQVVVERSAAYDRLEQAAILRRTMQIQAAWRGYHARKLAARLARDRLDVACNSAAARIQAAWRGRSVRCDADLLARRAQAAEHRAREAAARKAAAAVRIQAAVRGLRVRRRFKAALQTARYVDDDDFSYDGGSATQPTPWGSPPFGASVEAAGVQMKPRGAGSFQSIGLPSSQPALDLEASSVSTAAANQTARQEERDRRYREMIEKLMGEWGFKDWATAEAYYKARQRQLRQQSNSKQRLRMQDPQVRLAKFKQQVELRPEPAPSEAAHARGARPSQPWRSTSLQEDPASPQTSPPLGSKALHLQRSMSDGGPRKAAGHERAMSDGGWRVSSAGLGSEGGASTASMASLRSTRSGILPDIGPCARSPTKAQLRGGLQPTGLAPVPQTNGPTPLVINNWVASPTRPPPLSSPRQAAGMRQGGSPGVAGKTEAGENGVGARSSRFPSFDAGSQGQRSGQLPSRTIPSKDLDDLFLIIQLA
ncbi:hypothetical protein WJX72_001227 [[Myrmecia] bisecta]|uniref:Uncharacterized protein n=1 Tax=[Myrmecia] bisecta TaxID=41462 RepID=A0AAW1PVK2_9CHLO